MLTEDEQTAEQARYLINMGRVEIITHIICTLFCVGVLIPSIVVLQTVDKVEYAAGEYSVDYENTESYKGVAGCLVFATSAAILYHILAIIIRSLYISSVVEKHFNLYVCSSGILCVFFILSLLSGGIPTSAFAAKHMKLFNDHCLHVSFHRNQFCQHLQKVTDSEAASAVMCFLSMIVFVVLFLIMIGGHLTKMHKPESQEESSLSPDVPPPYDSLLPPSYESAIAMSYGQMDQPLHRPEVESVQ